MTVSVSDSSRPLTKLKRDDFTILDNKKPREIQSFWQESDVPLTIGLIADVSGSQIDKIEQHRARISQFLSQAMGPRDRAFIVTIGRYVKLVTDLTDSIDDLRAGIKRIDRTQLDGTLIGDQCPSLPRLGTSLPISIGHGRVPIPGVPPTQKNIPICGTALWNGLYSSARIKMKPLTGRKALIVFSDGQNNGTPRKLTDVIEAAQSADTLVYTFPTRSSKNLERLSEETGGRASALKSDPSAAFAQLETELRNLYVLGFTVPPEERDAKFHPLEVKTNIPGAIVRARKGYIPQSSF